LIKIHPKIFDAKSKTQLPFLTPVIPNIGFLLYALAAAIKQEKYMTTERKLSKKLQCLENIHILNLKKEGMFAVIVIKSL
jgi:hypothetical protein